MLNFVDSSTNALEQAKKLGFRSQLREALQLRGRVLVIAPIWHLVKFRGTRNLGQFVTLLVVLDGGGEGATRMAFLRGN